VGSIPITRSIVHLHEIGAGGFAAEMERRVELRAHVAQLVEHVLGKDEVTGSIPVVGSMREVTAVA
jgi:hypothetical protein